MSMVSNFGGIHSRSGYVETNSPMMNRQAVPVGFPTDEQLLEEIKVILKEANLTTLTKKQVRELLSVKYGGLDLKIKRDVINRMIDGVLKSM
jgi:hypothetical protein